jgi:hypothetical protein
MKQSEIPISELTQNKSSQLNLAISIPPMYLSVEKYQMDEQIGAVFYLIEIGIQKDNNVIVHYVSKRFSELSEFDSQIRSKFSGSKYLVSFPPKTLFKNTDRKFLEKRAEQLQNYLASLVRVAELCETSVFRRFFDISESLLRSL